MSPTPRIRTLTDADRGWARGRIIERWGSEVVVAHERVYRPAELEGFVAELGGEPAGLLTYVVEGDACEIVTLDAEVEGRGVGTALIDAVKALGQPRLSVTTTNDNERAIAFYRRRGFRIVAVHEGAVERSRLIKPEIPLHDDRGVPIRDEVELELRA
jgi:ribosomal protein S18 acetylase RimI-like enzyme